MSHRAGILGPWSTARRPTRGSAATGPRPTRRSAATGLTIALTALALAGCDLAGLFTPDAPYSPVILLATEGLEAPAVGLAVAFKPPAALPIDAADPARGSATGFFVTVLTAEPDRLDVRLVDSPSGAAVDFARVPPPGDAEARALAAIPQAFDEAARARLADGEGVYWLAETGPASDGSYGRGREVESCRLGVLVPVAALGPFTRLEAYTRITENGAAVGAARIELVQDFLYVAVIGDSIQWGNGLNEVDKISTRVIASLEQRTGRRVICQRYAQSGADIVTQPGDAPCLLDCNGELPLVSTSITMQADQIVRGELVELVLMDGCVNDIGLGVILDAATTDEDLLAQTDTFCHDAMRALLVKVRDLAPRAWIVVSGYYPMIGPASDPLGIEAWYGGLGLPPPEDLGVLVAELAHQSVLFSDTANTVLRDTVAEVNAAVQTGGADRIAFADPGFGPEHATFVPGSRLWGLTADSDLLRNADLELSLFPEDPLREVRLSVCLDQPVQGNPVMCLYASVGHPNPEGARTYAEAVLGALDALGAMEALRATGP